ncbi:IS200/IS605 family transposase [Ancylomarina euxinus]|uniref:IS200/IS605 family transposase n=1 Tax=Ancylomarina euxinus TaxID=2283627 RepID=A0A425Y060_9BACT|nr:IS200/IS605 family transposase [Ancylomarina euxinus]MCZ4695326.1 IS200/IS605 family transposase [Ancylomarina euxinus]MUP15521.1 IS200/IS605 family transposase [Ancylomarina euxinus]RRG21033.1 IS200/IS605 family transposase [Ancylomarina euxinus]
MGQSISQLYVHLTFSTKDSKPYIQEIWELKLYACLAEVLRKYNCPILTINSVSDHVHILFSLSKDHSLASVVNELKKKSVKWIRSIGKINRDFDWQDGYGAFSVSHFQIDVVTRFIQNQKNHHDNKTYKEEVDEIMEQFGVIEYDASYFWN